MEGEGGIINFHKYNIRVCTGQTQKSHGLCLVFRRVVQVLSAFLLTFSKRSYRRCFRIPVLGF